MNPPLTKYQLKKHREVLDEKYLDKQLIILTKNKAEILFDIRQYQKKHFNSYRNHFVHSRTVIKLLKANKRTIRLLASYKYISSFALCNNLLFNLTDISDFIKSLLYLNKKGVQCKSIIQFIRMWNRLEGNWKTVERVELLKLTSE